MLWLKLTHVSKRDTDVWVSSHLEGSQWIPASKRHGHSYPRHQTEKLMCNHRIREILPTRHGTMQHPSKHYGLNSRQTVHDINDVRLDKLPISIKTNNYVNFYIVSSASHPERKSAGEVTLISPAPPLHEDSEQNRDYIQGQHWIYNTARSHLAYHFQMLCMNVVECLPMRYL